MSKQSERGQALVEFALIIVLTAAAIIMAVRLTGPAVVSVYCGVLDSMQANSAACGDEVAAGDEGGAGDDVGGGGGDDGGGGGDDGGDVGGGGDDGGGGGDDGGGDVGGGGDDGGGDDGGGGDVGGGGDDGGGDDGGGGVPTETQTELPTVTATGTATATATETLEPPTATATETQPPPTGTPTPTETQVPPTETQPPPTATEVPSSGMPFTDDFSDGYGDWTIASGSNWSNSGGKVCATAGGEHRMFTGDSSWTDYNLTIGSAQLNWGDGYSIFFRSQGTSSYNGYSFQYDPDLGWFGAFVLRKWVNGAEISPAVGYSYAGWRFDWDAVREVEITAVGDDLKVYLNGDLVAQGTDSTYTSGGVGLGTWGSSNVCFDNVSVTAP